MMRKTILLAAMLGTVSFGFVADASAQITAQGGGYLFRMKFKQGEKSTYNMSITSPMSQQPMVMSFSQVVKKVTGDKATIEVTPPAMPGAKGAPQKATIEMNSRGQVTGGGASGMTQQMQMQFPAGPIKIGQSWSGNMDTSGAAMGGVKVSTTYKFVRVRAGAVPLAEVAVTMNGSNAQMKMNGSGIMLLRMTDGSLHSSNINSKITIPQPPSQGKTKGSGQPMTLDTKISITRK